MLTPFIVALVWSNSVACACALPYAALLAAQTGTKKKSDPRDLTVIRPLPNRPAGEARGRARIAAYSNKEEIHELPSAA